MLNFKDVYCDIKGSKFCINNTTDILLFRIYFRLIRPIALPVVSFIETKCLSFLNEQQLKWKLFTVGRKLSFGIVKSKVCLVLKKLVLVQIRSLEKLNFDLYTSLIEIIRIIYLHIIALLLTTLAMGEYIDCYCCNCLTIFTKLFSHPPAYCLQKNTGGILNLLQGNIQKLETV